MRTLKPYSNNDYIKSFHSGEEQGFDYFFNTWYKQFCFFATRYTNDIAAAEDIVSESFIRVWRKRESFTSAEKLKTYFYITIRNASFRWLDNLQRSTKHIQQLDRIAEKEDKAVIENIIRTELISQLYEAIKSLPPACQTIITKLYIEGKTIKETSIELQLAKTTVQTQKDRGIGLLRKLLPRPG